MRKKQKKHKNILITFAFVFQCRKTIVMLDEHEFYVLCIGSYIILDTFRSPLNMDTKEFVGSMYDNTTC